MVRNNTFPILLAFSVRRAGLAYALPDNHAMTSDVLHSSYESFAVRDVDYMSSIYAREAEPESAPREHEDLGGDDDHNVPSYSSRNHSTREVDGGAHASSNNRHQRRAALDYVAELTARSVDPDDHEDERLAHREQLDCIVELAVRYAPPRSQLNYNDNAHDDGRHSDTDERRPEARSGWGTVLPSSKALGNAIQRRMANNMHRRKQADDGDALDARVAFGMAFRPIAQELGRAFRTTIFEKELGSAFRSAFRTAVLEKVMQEIEDREGADRALQSREDVADAVDAQLGDIHDLDTHPRSCGEWVYVSTVYNPLLFLATTNRATETFEHLHPLATSNNLRTVAFNRTEYPGSPKYMDTESEELRHGDAKFLEGMAVASRTSSRRTSTFLGGVVVAEVMPLETYDLLNRYVGRLVFYDPRYLAFGLELPADAVLHDLWSDATTKSPEEVFETFKFWVSSYFEVLEGWAGSINKLDSRKRTEHATVDSLRA
ncbi:hypothetical protein BDN71DRAFT_1514121 [Pleurotus eryngii]|uniref:Uncharacterized protein n=1 Tax=Pleurotus eryngii TaxID=5323 RepID=A0A9P5ZK43_PLEER|nr:hypothetical protein BDN71DRAFT_1514121 [Pleurotus eryngii]